MTRVIALSRCGTKCETARCRTRAERAAIAAGEALESRATRPSVLCRGFNVSEDGLPSLQAHCRTGVWIVPCVRSRRPWLAVAAVGILGVDVAGGASTPVSSRLTPQAAVETVRIMIEPGEISPRNPHGAVSLSPDGKTYVARLVRGDVERNGVWMQMVAGRTGSLADAAQTRIVAHLFTSGLGAGNGRAGANRDTAASPLTWLDARHVAFLWSDAQGHRQVMRVNVQSGYAEALTDHPAGVLNFDVARNGAVLYSAMVPDEPGDLARQLRDGFAIDDDSDASSLLIGRVNDGSYIERLWRTQWFFKPEPVTAARPVTIAGRELSPNQIETAWLAEDGRWALVNAVAPSLPLEWDRYADPGMAKRLRQARLNPYSMLGRLVHQLFLLDTAANSSRPLWQVPSEPDKVRCAWSPAADLILIAPTLLPQTDADPRTLRGTAAVVMERESGRYVTLPIDLSDRVVASVQWVGRHSVALELASGGASQRIVFERSAGKWHRVDAPVHKANAVRFELRQDLDRPPVLVAIEERRGRSRTIVDPNPVLADRYPLGRASRIQGSLEGGHRWEGLLFHPPRYQPGRRYPLVIQSVYGSRMRDEFTLYGYQNGYGLGPSFIAPYPGRMLAQEDFLVLTLTVPEQPMGQSREPQLRALAFESAARQLIEAGLVDEARVGLLGFSRNGYYVEYAITHSSFPYAAAIAADHWDAGYVTQTLLGYDTGAAMDVNGAPPFGEGLSLWRASAPGFNVDRVRAPLMQIVQSRGLLGVLFHWETFSRLRYLNKPAELWVMPNAEFGAHNTQNPEQLVAVQTRVIDWFRFWMKSEEDASPRKRELYERWRRLRDQQREDSYLGAAGSAAAPP